MQASSFLQPVRTDGMAAMEDLPPHGPHGCTSAPALPAGALLASCPLLGSCTSKVVQGLFDTWIVTARLELSLRRRLGDEKDWFTLFL